MNPRQSSQHLAETALVCFFTFACGNPGDVGGGEAAASVGSDEPRPSEVNASLGTPAPTLGSAAPAPSNSVPSSVSGGPEGVPNPGPSIEPEATSLGGTGGVVPADSPGAGAGGVESAPTQWGSPSIGGGAAAPSGGAGGLAGLGGSPAGGAGGEPTAGSGNGGEAGRGGGMGGSGGEEPRAGGRLISFGTLLDADAAVAAARARAAMLSDPDSAQWRAKGDQRRSYFFDETGTDEPYRLYVPTEWDGEAPLPLVMFLHGAGSNENTYVDQNGGQMLELAQQHSFLLVAPLGADGAYGNFLRLSAPFGNEAGAAELMAQVTPESEQANQLSEQDVLNVLELVLAEYPIDRTRMFLTGHSMGSGGTWYIGGKYASHWRAIAPMSGPFVQETGYPWEDVREISILVSEGIQTPSLEGSRLLAEWLTTNGFRSEYVEVDADHGGMVPLVLPDVFEFFERSLSD